MQHMEIVKKEKVKNSLKWSFLLVAFNIISKFLIKIVLAKLLVPKDFGLITICFIIIPLAEIISDFGLSSVIIQKKYKKDLKLLSSIFWFNCFVGVLIFIFLNFLISPIFSDYYNEPDLTKYILVISLSLIYNPLILVKRTFLHIDLNFKLIFFINFAAVFVSSVVAILLALKGYGIWSLVFQYVISTFIVFMLYYYFIKWRFLYYFDFKKLIDVLKKSSYDMLTKIIGFIESNAQIIIISYFLSVEEIGYFNFAMLFTISILKPFNQAIKKVFFPFFSKIVNNKNRIKINHLNQIKFTLIVFIPLLNFLFFYSEIFLNKFFGDKWLGSILILKYLSLFLLIKCFTGTPNIIIKSLGYFNQFFYLQLIRTVIMILFLSFGLHFYNFIGMLIFMILAQILINIVDFQFIKFKINLKYNELLSTIIPVLFLLIFIVSVSYFQTKIFQPNLFQGIFISVAAYVLIYYYFFKKNTILKNDIS